MLPIEAVQVWADLRPRDIEDTYASLSPYSFRTQLSSQKPCCPTSPSNDNGTSRQESGGGGNGGRMRAGVEMRGVLKVLQVLLKSFLFVRLFLIFDL